MFSSLLIRTPVRYKTPDLNEGEEAVIHIIRPKQHFVNLKFNDKDNIKNIPNLTIGDSAALSNKVVKDKLKQIETKILKLDSIYTCYSYLFSVQNSNLYLISMAMENITLGFDIVKKIGKTLGIEVLTPCWSGVFTQHATQAFIEDVFIQKR